MFKWFTNLSICEIYNPITTIPAHLSACKNRTKFILDILHFDVLLDLKILAKSFLECENRSKNEPASATYNDKSDSAYDDNGAKNHFWMIC